MGKDLESLFEYLKQINEKLDRLDDKVNKLTEKQHNQQVSIKALEINVETINRNVNSVSNDIKDKVHKIEVRCEEHKKDIKEANNFMLTHNANEKTILNVRADIIAWAALLFGLIAAMANIDKLWR